MLVTINHPSLDSGEITYLSASAAAASPTLTVQDNTNFAANKFVAIGIAGAKRTELLKVTSITGGSVITLSSNLVYDHPSNTTISEIRYDKVKVYSSTSATGTFTEISGSPFLVNIDMPSTIFDDTSGSTATWYKTSYYNSQTSVESGLSSAMQGSGPKNGSLSSLITQVRSDMVIKNDYLSVTDDEITAWINEGISDIQKKRNWPMAESISTIKTIASQDSYDIPAGVSKIKRIKFTVGSANYYPKYITPDEFFEMESVTPAPASDAPNYYTIWAEKIYLRPKPSTVNLDITIYAYSELTKLTLDNDVAAISQPEILVYWANMMVMAKRKDKDWVAFWKNLYDAKLGDMVRSASGHKQMDTLRQVRGRQSYQENNRFRIVATTISQE